LGSSQKTFRATWCPKLVTGIIPCCLCLLVLFVNITLTMLTFMFVSLKKTHCAVTLFCLDFYFRVLTLVRFMGLIKEHKNMQHITVS